MSRLEDEVPRLAGRYRVFQQLRGYVTDLTDCYDEKVSRLKTESYFDEVLNYGLLYPRSDFKLRPGLN